MFAKRKPSAFIELAGDDNVQLRNVGIKAVEADIIKLSNDNRNLHGQVTVENYLQYHLKNIHIQR